MKVWVTTTERKAAVKFHASSDCVRLQRSRYKQLLEVDLDDLDHPDPCRECYPTAPRTPKIWRPACDQCYGGKQGPCPHNGGVLVLVEQRGKWPGKLARGTFDPDTVIHRRVYVWPENAHRYQLIEEEPVAPQNPRVVVDLRDRQRR